jgi:hypothetical protein
VNYAVAEEPFGLRGVTLEDVSGLGLDAVEVDVPAVLLERVLVHDPVDLPPLHLVAVGQPGRRLDELPVHVQGAGLVLPLRHRLLRRIPGVRRQRRPAAHARETAVLGVRDPGHLVRRGPEADLVLGDEGDALTQPGCRGAGDGVDPSAAGESDELLTGLRDHVS